MLQLILQIQITLKIPLNEFCFLRIEFLKEIFERGSYTLSRLGCEFVGPFWFNYDCSDSISDFLSTCFSVIAFAGNALFGDLTNSVWASTPSPIQRSNQDLTVW